MKHWDIKLLAANKVFSFFENKGAPYNILAALFGWATTRLTSSLTVGLLSRRQLDRQGKIAQALTYAERAKGRVLLNAAQYEAELYAKAISSVNKNRK